MRLLIGVLLILHGLAHAGAGMWAAGPVWLVTILWWLATMLYVSAGLGVLGFRPYESKTVELAFAALIPSGLLLGSFIGWFIVFGIALDFILLLPVIALRDRTEPLATKPLVYRSTAATVIAFGFVGYASATILLRPAAMRVSSRITIAAPADSVWPWVAQIGQDRAGFYSYDVLERMFGVRIRNADSIVPAWQQRQVGELVRCCQPGYLGGIFGDTLGWRVDSIEPGRLIALENWGAFVVTPIDSTTSRFHVRQRNAGPPTFVGNLIAPVGWLIFEPAHFIMQRGMLRGVKARAERS